MLRPLTNVLYLDQTGGRIPPTAFGEAWDLVQQSVPPDLAAAVAELLAAKRAGDELGETAPIPALDTWIAETFTTQDARGAVPGFAAKLQRASSTTADQGESFAGALDELFAEMVHEAAEGQRS